MKKSNRILSAFLALTIIFSVILSSGQIISYADSFTPIAGVGSTDIEIPLSDIEGTVIYSKGEFPSGTYTASAGTQIDSMIYLSSGASSVGTDGTNGSVFSFGGHGWLKIKNALDAYVRENGNVPGAIHELTLDIKVSNGVVYLYPCGGGDSRDAAASLVFNGTTLSSDVGVTYATTLPRDTWYRVKFTLDTATKTVYTSINGAVVYTAVSNTLGNSLYSVLYQQTDGATVSIDNIKYVVKDEPDKFAPIPGVGSTDIEIPLSDMEGTAIYSKGEFPSGTYVASAGTQIDSMIYLNSGASSVGTDEESGSVFSFGGHGWLKIKNALDAYVRENGNVPGAIHELILDIKVSDGVVYLYPCGGGDNRDAAASLVFNGTTLSSDVGVTYATSLPRDTWYRVKFTLDTATKTVYTSINGAVVYTALSATLGNSLYSVLYQETTGATVSIDNIKYVVKDEPNEFAPVPGIGSTDIEIPLSDIEGTVIYSNGKFPSGTYVTSAEDQQLDSMIYQDKGTSSVGANGSVFSFGKQGYLTIKNALDTYVQENGDVPGAIHELTLDIKVSEGLAYLYPCFPTHNRDNVASLVFRGITLANDAGATYGQLPNDVWYRVGFTLDTATKTIYTSVNGAVVYKGAFGGKSLYSVLYQSTADSTVAIDNVKYVVKGEADDDGDTNEFTPVPGVGSTDIEIPFSGVEGTVIYSNGKFPSKTYVAPAGTLIDSMIYNEKGTSGVGTNGFVFSFGNQGWLKTKNALNAYVRKNGSVPGAIHELTFDINISDGNVYLYPCSGGDNRDKNASLVFRGTTLTSDTGAIHGTLPRDTWYRIKFTLDTDTKTVYTSVNGAVVYKGKSDTLGNSLYSVLYQQTSGATVAIDNIKYVVKGELSGEPSTPSTPPDEPGDESEEKEPPLYYDFDDMTIGEQLYNGTVTEYKGNKMLKQRIDSSGKSTKFYAMIPGDAVFSFDFAVTGGPVEGKMTFESGNRAGQALTFALNGNVISYNNIQLTKYDEEVKNIAVVFKANQQNFDIYVNGGCVVKGCFTDIRFDKIVNVELYFKAPGEKADIYLDNIMAYPTYEKIKGAMIYDPDAKPVWDKEIILTDNTWFIDEETEKTFMEDKVSVHMRSGVVCVNNKKTTLENMPYVNGDELMVPAEFFKTAYGITPSVSDAAVTLGNNIILDLKSPKITIGNKTYDIFCSPGEKDGVMYLPLRAIVEKGMSKHIYHDTTATHSGMVIISDARIEPKTGDELQNLNDYCFYVRPTKEQWLADYNASPLKGQHPRVMATAEDFERLKKEIETNERKKEWFEYLIKYCNGLLDEPTLKYELRDGIRLMYVSSEFTDWVTSLSFAYKMTGDKKYLDAAWRQIEAVAAFPDWNPIHHIDVGIMALGFGIAYDWLYHDLTLEQRAIMERAVFNNLYWIVNEAHQDFYTVYGDPGMKDNHNVLCNAGLVTCIIAFMDVYPEVGSQLGAHTMRLLERFMWLFAPIGSYFEGPSYASVSIDYATRLFAAMEPSMGTLYGLDKAEAFDLSADYILNMQSDVASFGFGDGNSDLKRSAGMLWLYDHYGIKGKQDAAADLLSYVGGQDTVEAILHYNIEQEQPEDTSALSIYYPGEDLVLARNSFDRGQVYVGLKCGGTLHSHSHLDSGSFVFDAMGTRWAHDLGQDDYNLQWEWGFYDIYRRRPESHNTLIIDPDGGYGYELDGRANFLSYDIKPKGVIAKTDLTELYGDKVTSAKRGFFFTDDRRSLVVRDEVSLTGNSDLYWLMCISEKAEIIDENTVILTKRNNSSKKVKIEFISSTGEGTIEIGAAAPFPTSPQIPEQNPNKGYQRLSYKVSGSGNVNITAKITPMGFEASDISEYDKNMDLWTIPNGGETDEFVFDSQTNEVKIKVSKDEFSSDEGTVVAALYEKDGTLLEVRKDTFKKEDEYVEKTFAFEKAKKDCHIKIMYLSDIENMKPLRKSMQIEI